MCQVDDSSYWSYRYGRIRLLLLPEDCLRKCLFFGKAAMPETNYDKILAHDLGMYTAHFCTVKRRGEA